jgi:hypothetical protein
MHPRKPATSSRKSRRAGMIAAAVVVAGLLGHPPGARAAENGPCAANPQSRALDFWLGDWTIAAPGGGDASSHVTQDLDHCLVVERWQGGEETGVNLFGYSADDGSWHGLFANNQGKIHAFLNGTVASGVAVFTGPNRGPDGTTIQNRITIRRIDANHAEQSWEKSSDGGKAWTTLFRLGYTRVQP